MEIIAQKKKGIWLLYVFTLLLSLFMPIIIAIIPRGNVLFVILLPIWLIFSTISIVILVQYTHTPKNAILYNESEKAIYLNDNLKIHLNEIEDLSYVRAAARGIQYKWGTVKIKTKDSKYVVRYIADCEDVCKRLTHLKYTSGNTSLFFNQ